MASTTRVTRRLITISASHFCEKARWALDRAGIAYVEEGHLPNFHYLPSFRLARTPFVPILVDAGKVIPDSTAILHHVDGLVAADARLFPPGVSGRDAQRFEARFDQELGPAARVWAYWNWFDHPEVMLRYASHGTPRMERLLGPLLLGVMKAMTSRRLSVNCENARRALEVIHSIFGDVGALLGDGRRFLAGDRFTAADLAFASLSGPVLLPPGHGVPLPRVEEAPPAMREEIERLRATPAGRLALRLYAEERRAHASAPVSCEARNMVRPGCR